MQRYIVLLRGINVGGKNKVPMAMLKKCLADLGYDDVVTYIASGNVLVRSNKKPDAIKKEIEAVLPKHFRLDTDLLKVLVLTAAELRRVVAKKPKGFGDSPAKYHSDVIFLIGFPVPEALKSFKPKEGVDRVWPGPSAIYSERLSAKRTQSRLNRVMGTPSYQHMTIRNWNTVTKLVSMLDK